MVLAQHARINRLGKGAVLMQLCNSWMCGSQNRGSRNCKSYISIIAKQYLRPRPSGAHGTSHACHTLDTSLGVSKRMLPVENITP